MYKTLTNYIKSKPRLYDVFDRMRPLQSETQRWLDSFSKRMNRKVAFIQIGANDGLRWDPVRRFVVRDKWKGVLVEPLPHAFDMLKSNYAYVNHGSLTFVNAAVTSSTEQEYIDIWSYSEDFCRDLSLEDRLYFLRKSSLNRLHVEQALRRAGVSEDHAKCFRVKCLPINNLIHTYFPNGRVDLVFVDAEGHDDEIVRGIDFASVRPKAVLFESHNLGKRKKPLCDDLAAHGYHVSDIGGDTVAELAPSPSNTAK